MIMPAPAQLVVIGSEALYAAMRQAMPSRNIIPLDAPLAAVWSVPEYPQADIILSLTSHPNARQALSSLRKVAPNARILLTCRPMDEPAARAALAAGADDYLLEPLDEVELLAALPIAAAPKLGERQQSRPSFAEPSPAGAPRPEAPRPEAPRVESPTTESPTGPAITTATSAAPRPPRIPQPRTASLDPQMEIASFANVLQHLDDGPTPILQRLAPLVRDTLAVEAVAIDYGEHYVRIGQLVDPMLEMPFQAGEHRTGRVRITPGAAPVGESQLAPLANLIATTLQAAETRKQLNEMAWRDDLSGLYNRRSFEQSLDRLIQTAAEQRSQLTVLLFDIDDFKTYNDQYGDDTGDALIRELAELLRRSSRADDIVARYGGDEFIVIFWDAEAPRVAGSKHPTEVITLAERFQHTIATHAFECLGAHAPGPVTISGGLSCYPWHGMTREELVRAADQALLGAKRNGKNKIALAGSDFPEQH